MAGAAEPGKAALEAAEAAHKKFAREACTRETDTLGHAPREESGSIHHGDTVDELWTASCEAETDGPAPVVEDEVEAGEREGFDEVDEALDVGLDGVVGLGGFVGEAAAEMVGHNEAKAA